MANENLHDAARLADKVRQFNETRESPKPGIIDRLVNQMDMVNHPAHYQFDDPVYEPAKVIRAWGLNFFLGNVVKYIARAGRKGDAVEDLRKSRWYLTAEIDALDPPHPADAAVLDHDSSEAYEMIRRALKQADMTFDPTAEPSVMRNEVRVLRAIADQGWVVIRAEHL